MNVEGVESLLERSRPAPPPPDLRRRVLEAAALRVPRPPVSPRKPRFVEVMTMAASILMLFATFSWLIRATPPAPDSAPAQEPGQPFEDRRMTDQLPGERVTSFSWSADGKHWACVVVMTANRGEECCAVVDGKRERTYASVERPLFGADGKYAYIAYDAKEGWRLVLNGVPQGDFDSYNALAWSPDGKRLAYAGLKGGRWHVVVDGKPGEPYGELGDLQWSPDGKGVAHSAKIDQDHFSVVDGKKGEPFDAVRHLTYSPDGRTVAYAACEGDWMMVAGGVKGREFHAVGPPVFSADGKTVGHFGQTAEGRFVILTGPVGGPLQVRSPGLEEAGSPVFSRDGKAWAYRAKSKEGSKESVVVTRETKVQRQVMKADKTGIETVEQVVLVDETGDPFDSVGDPVLSPDGSRVAYAAAKGTRRYLVLGRERTVKFSLIDRISFGPDGKTVAFRAGQYGKQFVVAGRQRSEEFDEIVNGPVWSADGKKVAFTSRTGSELWSRILELK